MGEINIERTFANENIRSGSRALETAFLNSPVASTGFEASEIHPQRHCFAVLLGNTLAGK